MLGSGGFDFKAWMQIAALFPLLLIQACSPSQQAPKHTSLDYNVILISIDTLRADHLGAYGYPRDTSPHIDAFAADSVQFNTAIAQAPSTLPSHASIFTGLIPVKHGSFAALQAPISPEVSTLPEILSDAGFRTMSWNGGGLVGSLFGFGRGFDEYITDRDNDRFADKVALATEWLDSNPNEKFFMFLHTYEVHDPYDPDPEYMALFDGDYSGELPDKIDVSFLAKVNSGKEAVSAEDVQHIRNAYDGEIRSMDEAFGKLLAYLKAQGLYDDTLIIFTSDHGEEFGEHGGVGRHFFTLYDELLHVPLIIKMPGLKMAGSVVDEQVRGLDILPTVLDVLAVNADLDIDGQSLISLMQGKPGEKLIAVSQQDTSDVLPPTSIRTANRKLIVFPPVLDNPEESYRWFAERMEFESSSTTLTIPMASVDAGREVVVRIDGKGGRKIVLTTERQDIPVVLGIGGQQGVIEDGDDSLDPSSDKLPLRHVVIESTSPCVKTDDTGPGAGDGCVSFRVFDPQQFYDLDADPGELTNLYADEQYAEEIEFLRNWLGNELAGGGEGASESVEMDDETRRQLKSLGYLN